MKRATQKQLSWLILGLMIVCFSQACTPSSTDLRSGLASLASKNPFQASNSSGGNGDFYGGKPSPGIYVRSVPEMNCGSQKKNLGEIIVTETGVSGTFVDPKTCLEAKEDLSQVKFDFSAYATNRIGLKEGIYARQDPQSTSEDRVVEAWCRRSDSNFYHGIDVVIEANYKTREYFARVSSSKPGVNGQPEVTEHYEAITVDRKSPKPERVQKGSRDVVKYRAAGDDFQLNIEPKTFDLATGKMKATFVYRLRGFDIDAHWFCRLGGELDPRALNRPY